MSIHAHPELPEFDYVRPGNWMEASRFLAEHAQEARLLLGGTDLFVRLRDGAYNVPGGGSSLRYVVDVKHLDGSQQLCFEPGQGLTIGAAVHMNRLVDSPEVGRHYPVLAEACRSVASRQLRTRATVIGNICNASPAGDTIGACLVLDGVLQVHSLDGVREEPLNGFFLGPGRTRLRPGDIVTALRLPLPHPGSVGTYLKLGRNRLSDLSIVGVTVLAYPAPELPSGWRFRLALASVAPTPWIPSEAEACLSGQPIDDGILKQAARLAQQACRPIDDVRASAAYRSAMVRNLTYQALQKVWKSIETKA